MRVTWYNPIVAALLLVGLTACRQQPAAEVPADPATAAAVAPVTPEPEPAANGDLPEVLPVTSAEHYAELVKAQEGKVVLVNFWATWCAPCVEEFPHLVSLARKYAEQMTLITVSADLSDDLPGVREFLAKHDRREHVYIQQAEDDNAFIEGVHAEWGGELPFTLLYGRDGALIETFSGSRTEEEFEAAIKRALE